MRAMVRSSSVLGSHTGGAAIGESPSDYYDRLARERALRRIAWEKANDYIGRRFSDDPADPFRLARRISISKSVYYERAKRIRRLHG